MSFMRTLSTRLMDRAKALERDMHRLPDEEIGQILDVFKEGFPKFFDRYEGPTEIEVEGEDQMVFLNGRDKPSFRCTGDGGAPCGCNVFRLKKGTTDRYVCNACKTIYIGE